MLTEKFNEIKNKYKEFERQLMQQGKLPMWDTGLGFWNGANCDEVFELFKKLNLYKYRHLIDLGSGDGRVVLIAGLFTKATGIEVDKKLVGKAEEIKSILGIKNADFINKNFFEHNISGHDIVFVNPDMPMHRGLENKLLKELKGKLIVYGHHFHPTLFIKENEIQNFDNFVAVYRK